MKLSTFFVVTFLSISVFSTFASAFKRTKVEHVVSLASRGGSHQPEIHEIWNTMDAVEHNMAFDLAVRQNNPTAFRTLIHVVDESPADASSGQYPLIRLFGACSSREPIVSVSVSWM